MNILVVEDHPMVREVLVAVARYVLRDSEVHAVGDLASALEAARATPMDAVLLDLGLPGCKGVDPVRRFKADFPSAAIVVVSSNEDRDVISAALEAGASDYLPKGLTPAGLAKALAGTRLGQQPDWLVPELTRSLAAIA